jgi:RHS repeat-associated protein
MFALQGLGKRTVGSIQSAYDETGAVNRRDEWVLGVAGRIAATDARRADGAVTRTTVELNDGAGAVLARFAYRAKYDSAARPVKAVREESGVETATLWELQPQPAYGAYDASGRAREAWADDGRARTVRTYSATTGLLTSDVKTLGGADVYRVDFTEYQGRQLRRYRDGVVRTSFAVDYDGGTRVTGVHATPDDVCALDARAAALAQGGDELFSFTLTKEFAPGPSLGNVEAARSVALVCQAGQSLGLWSTERYDYRPDNADRLASIALEGPAAVQRLTATEAFRFDGRDRLRSVERDGVREALAYDGFGQLVVRVRPESGTPAAVTWLTAYAGQAATIAAPLPEGCSAPSTPCQASAAAARLEAHVNVGGVRVATIRSDSTLYYYRDRLGSVVATSLSGGVMGAQYRYGPYGEIRSFGETAANRSELGFTGALRLGGDLVHLKARAYHAGLRKFLQPDSVDPYRYTYAIGNPVNYVDLLGLQAVPSAEALAGYILDPSQVDDSAAAMFEAFVRPKAPDHAAAGQSQAARPPDAPRSDSSARMAGAQSRGSVLRWPVMDAATTDRVNTVVNALDITTDVIELRAVSQGTKTAAALAQGLGVATTVGGIALDAWALKVDPKMTPARFTANSTVAVASLLIGGYPGAALGAGYIAVDKLAPEAPDHMVTMDEHGKLHVQPWNYGGGWGGIAYTLHPENYEWALRFNEWFKQIGILLPSNMGL